MFFIHPLVLFVLIRKTRIYLECKMAFIVHDVYCATLLSFNLWLSGHFDHVRCLKRLSLPAAHAHAVPDFLLHGNLVQWEHTTPPAVGMRTVVLPVTNGSESRELFSFYREKSKYSFFSRRRCCPSWRFRCALHTCLWWCGCTRRWSARIAEPNWARGEWLI